MGGMKKASAKPTKKAPRKVAVKAPTVKAAAAVKAKKARAPKGSIFDALDKLGIDAVCEALRGGDTYREISKKVGGSKGSLISWLSADKDRSARAREARSIGAAAYDEEAEQLLRDAKDPFELARARELAQHLRWRSSKINPEYGDKFQFDGNIGVRALPEDELNARLAAKLGAATALGAAGVAGIAGRAGSKGEPSED